MDILAVLKARREHIQEEISWLEEEEAKFSSAVLEGQYDLAQNIYTEQLNFLDNLIFKLEKLVEPDQLFQGILVNLQPEEFPMFVEVFSGGKIPEF